MLTNRIKLLWIILSAIALLGSCQKEEVDMKIPEGETGTTVKGRIVTNGDVGLAGIRLEINYTRSTPNILGGSLKRLKSTGTTDKNGAFSLSLYLQDDELTKEEGYFKSYYLQFDMSALDREKYILPGDLDADPADLTHMSYIELKRDTTYETNFYLPLKRYIPVTLKGYQRTNRTDFTVYTTLPWGFEKGNNYIGMQGEVIDTQWQERSCPIGLFRSEGGDVTFTNIPFALNDTTIVNVWRTYDDGTSGIEHVKIFVTETKPETLSFDFAPGT